MLMDDHRASGQRVTEAALIELPASFFDSHRVVLRYYPLGLQREGPLQIRSRAAPECRASLGCLHRELRIELRDIALTQKPVRLFRRRDPGQTQLLRQAPLPRPETPFRAPLACGE